MPQELLVRIMEIMCLAGAGLGVCLLILAVMVFRCIENLNERVGDLESVDESLGHEEARP